MANLQTHLDKLRSDAAECHMLSNIATEPARRDLFAKLAEHMSGLATEIEKSMAGAAAPVPTEHQQAPSLDQAKPSMTTNMETTAVAPYAAALELPSGPPVAYEQPADAGALEQADQGHARTRGVLPWLLVLGIATIGGACAWIVNAPQQPSSLAAAAQPGAAQPGSAQPSSAQSSSTQASAEPVAASADPKDETKAAIASLHQDLKDSEQRQQNDRKSIADQINAISARLDNLEKARAEAMPYATSADRAEDSRPAPTRLRRHFRVRDRRYNPSEAWLFPGLR